MPAVPIIGLAVGAIGVGASIYEASKANSAAEQALQFQEQQANLQAQVEQRQAIRQSRAAYAQSQQEAANQGVGDSSASQGGLGSIRSQLDQNLSFLDQYNKLSDAAGQAIGTANADRTASQMFGAIGGFGMQVFAEAPAINSSFNSIFGNKNG